MVRDMLAHGNCSKKGDVQERGRARVSIGHTTTSVGLLEKDDAARDRPPAG